MPEQLLTTKNNTRDNLLAGYVIPVLPVKVIVESGQGQLSRGAALGQKTRALGAATPGGGNVGNGTIGSVAMRAKTKKGVYSVVFIGANDFRVFDPEGVELKRGVVGSLYSTDFIQFQITAGGTLFSSDDQFTIIINAGNEKFVHSAAAAVDGSAEIRRILAVDVDATSSDVDSEGYLQGEFNKERVNLNTHALADVQEALEARRIFIKPVIKN